MGNRRPLDTAQKHPRNPWTPISDGTCRTQLFPPADLPVTVSLRERLCGAIHGEGVRIRVSAEAVGRRGHFPEGRLPPNFRSQAPPGNAPSGGDRQSSRLRHPSAHATRFADPSLSARQAFVLASVPMRHRRPGLGNRGRETVNRVRDRDGSSGDSYMLSSVLFMGLRADSCRSGRW